MIEIALTIDDLPRHGEIGGLYDRLSIISMILETIKELGIPPICGFVNGYLLETFPEDRIILERWVAANGLLGNHTYSHCDLSKISGQAYIDDIQKNESILARFFPGKDKFFRYPFLLEGETEEKFFQIKNFLQSELYKIVPVTMDYLDFAWNTPVCKCLEKNDMVALEELKQLYIEEALIHLDAAVNMAKKIFQKNIKHILLLHAGIATALFMKDMLKALQGRGCKFIGLADALLDNVYHNDPILITPKAPNFLIRWAKLNNIEIAWPHVKVQRINQIAGIHSVSFR